MQWIKDYFELCSRSYLESDRPAFSGETRLCLAVCGRIFPKPGIRQQKQTPGHSHICPNQMDLCSLLCRESRTILNYAADHTLNLTDQPSLDNKSKHQVIRIFAPIRWVHFYAENQGLFWIMQPIIESDRPAFSGETRLCLAVCGRIFPKPGIRQQKQTPGHSHICPNKMDLCSLLCSESRTILNYAADQLYLERPASAWPCVHARWWDHSPCMLGQPLLFGDSAYSDAE